MPGREIAYFAFTKTYKKLGKTTVPSTVSEHYNKTYIASNTEKHNVYV